MALPKQILSIPFAHGIDTKTDPFQLSPDRFLSIVNAVYTKDKKLTKRNGFPTLTQLPDGTNATIITTFNGNLTAVGDNFLSYSADNNQWINKGSYSPVRLATQSLVRSSLQQSEVDSAVASNGLVCTVYKDGDGNYKYQISDQLTDQVLVKSVNMGSALRHPRVYVLGVRFVILFTTNSPSLSLRYIAIPFINLTSPTSPTILSTVLTAQNAAYDAFTDGTNLYIGWSRTATIISTTILDLHLNQHQTTNHAIAATADNISLTVDLTQNTQVIYITYHETGASTIKMMVLDSNLVQTLADTVVATDSNIASHLLTLASSAQNNLNTIFISLALTYSFSSVENDYIYRTTCTNLGVVGTYTQIADGFAAASKSFLSNGLIYILVAHQSSFQPTYYLLNSSGSALARLAYQNGGGDPNTIVLPNVWIYDQVASVGYQFKDFLVALNKAEGVATLGGLYTQLGLNLATFNLASGKIVTAEIGNNLHLAGGFLWMYDGTDVVEHGFHLYPEDFKATPSTTGGSMADQNYNYQITYEWTDSQGNIHRSAPSLPLLVTVSGGSGSGSVLLNIPTLRLTYKTSVRIVVYRWSTAQQSFYATTSVTSPLLNDPSVDSVAFTDTNNDSDIIGNALIYTTGGVVENIPAPACNVLALYKSRLMLIDAEDTNLIWFSKPVIEAVPVEMSDSFTIYLAPTIGVQGSTGSLTALSALDDKLIGFKQNAIYYITGIGPDITGANNDFSDPIFITSTVGCADQQSIAFIPMGLTFQSTNGIWLLERNLETNYLGAPVEAYNDNVVVSALNPPGTNEARLSLDNGITLMYDFYYSRWGTFSNTPVISSTIYSGAHTYLMSTGEIRQEVKGVYTDGAEPVLMSFSTAWFNLAGLQGYERFYMFYILGQFKTPNKLNINISYDYNPSPSQSVLITANNYALPYGGGSYYGDQSPYANDVLEQWRIFAKRQRCQAFQITVNELYDAQYNTIPGEGLSFSGINLVYGLKKGFNTQSNSTSAG